MAREGGETKCLKILTAFKDFQGRVRRMYNFLTWVAGLRDHSKKKKKKRGVRGGLEDSSLSFMGI